MDKKCYVRKLSNGMTVLLVPRKTSLFSVEIEMKNGRIDEHRHTLSYTHTGEHLLSMLTSGKYQNFTEINRTLGFLGVTTNAYTSDFTTGYWIKGPDEYFYLYLDLFSNMYFDYEFHDDWAKQKNIVMEEIKSRSSNVWNDLYETEAKILYPHAASLSAGWEKNLKVLKRAKLSEVVRYNKRKLEPSLTLLKVEGDFDPKNMFQTLSKYFDHEQNKKFEKYQLEPPDIYPPYRGPQTRVVKCPSNTSKILLHYENDISIQDEAGIVETQVLLDYFVNGYFSHLYQLLREKCGLIYGLSAKTYYSPDSRIPSFLEIEINADPQNVQRVLRIALGEVSKLKTRHIPNQGLKRVRNSIHVKKSKVVLDQHIGKYANFYGRRVLWDQKPITYKCYFQMLTRVSTKHIIKRAQQIFQPQRLLIMVGKPKQKIK